MKRFFYFFILPGLFLFSCKNSTDTASFYYWRTVFSLSDNEMATISKFNTKKLYLRYFDIDKKNDSILPIAAVIFKNKLPDNINFTPVVFITNRTFTNLSTIQAQIMAENIIKKIKSISLDNKIKFNAIQIDCDWSDNTKTLYFFFLKELKKLLPESTTLSCTVRLHQIKYAYKTGVPPVDETVLMFYNMGKLNNSETNSIYNKEDALKYVSYIKYYPLKMSYALPLFGWIAHYRNNKAVNLSAKQTIFESDHLAHLKKIENGFIVESSFLHKGIYYKEGDELKLERLSESELLEAAKLLSDNSTADKHEIIFFDLDEHNLKTHQHETLKKVLASFNF